MTNQTLQSCLLISWIQPQWPGVFLPLGFSPYYYSLVREHSSPI
jgi:hypothetical protein